MNPSLCHILRLVPPLCGASRLQCLEQHGPLDLRRNLTIPRGHGVGTVSLFAAQLLGIITEPLFSFRLIWVAAITIFPSALAMVDPAEVYKIHRCAGLILLVNLRPNELPSHTSPWSERHVVSVNCQLLHSLRGGDAVLLVYPGRFPRWKGEPRRIVTFWSTDMYYSTKVSMLFAVATVGNGAAIQRTSIAIATRLLPVLRRIAGELLTADNLDLLLLQGMVQRNE